MPPPRSHPLIRLVICVLGIGVLCSIVFAVIMAALVAVASLVGQPSASYITTSLTRNALLIQMLLYPPALLWIWFCRRAIDRRSFVSLGLRRSRSVKNLALGAACGTLTITFLFGVLWLTGYLSINGWSPEAFEAGPFGTLWMLALYAGVFCAVGFMEEISFRGYGVHNLAAWLGIRGAIILQAVIFALIHLTNLGMKQMPDGTTVARPAAEISGAMWDARWAMINILLIGIFFAVSYIKTGSLWFPIGFHIAWNFALGCIFSLPVSGIGVFRVLDVKVAESKLVTGGEFGAEGSILLIPILGVLLLLLQRQPNHPQAQLDLALLQTPSRGADVAENSVAIPAPVPVPGVPVTTAVNGTTAPPSEEPISSRFKTTMRPKEPVTTQDAPLRIDIPAANRTSHKTRVIETEASPLVQTSPPAEPPITTEPVATQVAPAEAESVPLETSSKLPRQQDQEKVREETTVLAPVEAQSVTTQPGTPEPSTARPVAPPPAKPARPSKPKW